jgi:hypothetical protein
VPSHGVRFASVSDGEEPSPSKVGFAANPPPTRMILDGTGGLAPTPGAAADST